jgi:chromosome segregation ATPase
VETLTQYFTITLSRTTPEQLQKALDEKLADGWEVVKEVENTKARGIYNKEGMLQDSYVSKKYTCIIRKEQEKMNVVKAVDELVKENATLNKKLTKALGSLSQLQAHNDKTKEKIKLTRAKNQRIETENQKLKEQLQSAKDQIKLLSDQLDNYKPKETAYQTKRSGKAINRKGYRAAITYAKREIEIGYFPTPEKAKKAEKQALLNLA